MHAQYASDVLSMPFPCEALSFLGNLHNGPMSRYRREPAIHGDKWSGERFGERDITRVIRRHVRAQFPNAGYKQVMRVALDRESPEVVERFPAAPRSQGTG